MSAPDLQPRQAVEVIVYGTARCPYCVRARALLERKGIAYDDIRLEQQPERRAEMERLSKRRTVPQIFIGGAHIGGSDELHELEYTGKLNDLLGIGDTTDKARQ